MAAGFTTSGNSFQPPYEQLQKSLSHTNLRSSQASENFPIAEEEKEQEANEKPKEAAKERNGEP